MARLNQDRCALLVVDMQEYFRAIAAPILSKIIRLIQGFRQANLSVIFTRHAHQNPVEAAGMLAKWWKELIIDGTPEAEILPEVQPLPAEKIIHKQRYSAFFQTDLHHHLKQQSIQQLIISGVMTNLCCETTARDAFVHDYEVFFLKDATATISEDFQQATLLNLSYGFAHLVTCQEVCEALNL